MPNYSEGYNSEGRIQDRVNEKSLRLEFSAFEPDLEQSGVLTKSVSDAMKSFLESDGNDDVASSFFLVKLHASQALPQGSPAKPTAHANVVDTRSQLPCSPLPKQQQPMSPLCPPTQASLPLLTPPYVGPQTQADHAPRTKEALAQYVLDWGAHVAHHEGQRE